jgi:hypothetical protein
VVLENGLVSEEGRYDELVSGYPQQRFLPLCTHPTPSGGVGTVIRFAIEFAVYSGKRMALIMQSRREGSRFRTLMAAQLLVEQSSGESLQSADSSIESTAEKPNVEVSTSASGNTITA